MKSPVLRKVFHFRHIYNTDRLRTGYNIMKRKKQEEEEDNMDAEDGSDTD